MHSSKVFLKSENVELEIVYTIRGDGLFIFRIGDNNFNNADIFEAKNLILISSLIKNKEGHTHIYHSSLESDSFPTLSVFPVELDCSFVEKYNGTTLEQILSKPEIVVNLEARNYSSKTKVNHKAVALIRTQFARIFEKTLIIRNEIRGFTIKINNYNIKLYSFINILLFYLVLMIPFIVYRLFIDMSMTSLESGYFNLIIPINTIEFFKNIFWYTFILLLAIIFILENSFKRRRVLKALWKSKGYLKYGSIYTDVLASICKQNELLREPTGFEKPLEIIDEIIDLEKKKRKRMQFSLLGISVFSIYPLLDRICLNYKIPEFELNFFITTIPFSCT